MKIASMLSKSALTLSIMASVGFATNDEQENSEISTSSGPFTTLHQGGEARIPYYWPLFGPSGTPMTRAFPLERGHAGEAEDHPHHVSLWFAHGDVGGHDFWHAKGERPARIVPVGDLERRGEGESTQLVQRYEWRTGNDRTLLRELRRVRFDEADGRRTIDFDFALKAMKPLAFGDTKEGTFAMRLNPALRLRGEVARGHALNSEGDADMQAWGKRARWVTYFGPVDERVVGVALFDHPRNLRHPCWWHARDYGLVAANPFGAHDFEKAPPGTGNHELVEGATMRLRYRVVLFDGEPSAEEVDSWWRDWAGVEGESDSSAPASEPAEEGEGGKRSTGGGERSFEPAVRR